MSNNQPSGMCLECGSIFYSKDHDRATCNDCDEARLRGESTTRSKPMEENHLTLNEIEQTLAVLKCKGNPVAFEKLFIACQLLVRTVYNARDNEESAMSLLRSSFEKLLECNNNGED